MSENWNLDKFSVPVNSPLDQKRSMCIQAADSQLPIICKDFLVLNKVRYTTPANQLKSNPLSLFPNWPANF